jgi:DNA adenine methylase
VGIQASVDVFKNRCTSLDFAEVIEDTSCRCLLYLDPPYWVAGNKLYQCGFSKDDHERLASLLKTTTHDWVLSYDDCPEIRGTYNWAKTETVQAKYTITAKKSEATGKRRSRVAQELLLSNSA